MAVREKIGGDYENIIFLATQCESAVRMVLRRFGNRNGWVGREGGYLCIADGKNGLPILTVLVGKVPPHKARKYLAFCQEKAGRLAGNRGHLSSWESRDPQKDHWGGAIRFNDYILSFSGLPEMGDEAAMLVAAMRSNIGATVVKNIAQRSKNPYWCFEWN